MYNFISMNLTIFSFISLMYTFSMMNFKLNKLIEWNFMNFNSMKFEFIIYLDWMSMMFISTIFIISSMVILYSLEYMKMELNIKKFMMLILIFVISMIMMIISPNIMSILLGWDLLGLSSYCLIIFYQNMKSLNSGLFTILMNRFGDICILMSITIMIYLTTWNFMFLNKKLMFLLTLFITIAALTKSAQIPFSTWLPLAMAAPTPVSALVHSSTLVTAGVYLLIRFNKIFNMNILLYIMYISMATMFMAGMNAIFEFDFKKIIALSTLSQLALMIFILSFNLPKLSFFHLINHAMFKSLLFLCSGIIIHNINENQDIRFISINLNNMPFTNLIFNLSTLALCGIPFLTGFYSKDLIIEMFNMLNNNYIVFLFLYSSMLLTLMYSLRLIYFTSIMNSKIINMNFNSMNNIMYKSIMILMLMSMILGTLLNWLMFSSMNMIFLDLKNKLFIYLNFIFTMPLIFFFLKMNFFKKKKNYYLMKMINFSFMLNLIYKKNKMNLMYLNLNLLKNNDIGWIKHLTIIMFLNKILKIMMKFNLNFLFKLMLLTIMFFLLMLL